MIFLTFLKIKHIFVSEDDKIYLTGNAIQELFFDAHFQAFRVDPNEQNLQSCPLDIIHGITNMIQQCNGQYYVVNKW